MTTAKALGERIAQERREKAARERRDITQRDVAEAIETSGANLSRWETGQAIPGDEFLSRLAEYFGVSRSWLRYGEGPREAKPEREIPLADPALYKRVETKGAKKRRRAG